VHFVLGGYDAEGLLGGWQGRAVGFVGDDDFGAGEHGVDFGEGEDDLVAVFGGSDEVAGHGFAGHGAAEGDSGFGEDVVEQDAFVGGGVAVGGERGGGAGHFGEIGGGERERGGAYDFERCRRGGLRGGLRGYWGYDAVIAVDQDECRQQRGGCGCDAKKEVCRCALHKQQCISNEGLFSCCGTRNPDEKRRA